MKKAIDILTATGVAAVIVALVLVYIVSTKGSIDIRLVRFTVVSACTFGFIVEQNWKRGRLWKVVIPCLTLNLLVYAVLWRDLLVVPMVVLWAIGLGEVVLCTVLLRRGEPDR